MKKRIIWAQLTGSHFKEHPERLLYKDNHFYIGGTHNMKALVNEEKISLIESLIKTEVQPPPENKNYYPDKSWFYDNKMRSPEFIENIEKIKTFDKTANIIFFSVTPYKSVYNVAKYLKDNYPESSKIVYYKRFIWDAKKLYPKAGGLKEGQHEDILDNTRLDEIICNREIEKQIIDISDYCFLADTHNTKGYESSNPKRKRSLIKKRNEILKNNKKIELKCLNGEVYNLISRIKKEW